MSLPILEPPFDHPPNVPPGDAAASVAGVLLAAGESSRFGPENKLLARLDGEPVVRHAARALNAADLGEIVAVIRPGSRVGDALADLPLSAVPNPDAERGQAASVRAGVKRIREAHDAAVIALGDMPRVTPATIDRLVAAYRATSKTALAAAHEGERGNPVLFDACHFDALTRVRGDAGGREILLGCDDAALVETEDPGVIADVDTPGDLTELR